MLQTDRSFNRLQCRVLSLTMQMCSSLTAFDMAIQLLSDRLSLCFPVLHSGVDLEQANAYIRWCKDGAKQWVDPDSSDVGRRFSTLMVDELQLPHADPE